MPLPLPRPISSYFKPKSKEEEEADRKAYENYKDIVSTWQAQEKLVICRSLDNRARHRDSWYAHDSVMPGVLAAENHFKSRPTDVLLVTSPKSGTTWTKALLFSAIHCRGSMEHRQDFARLMATANPHEWVPVIELQVYRDGMIPDLDDVPSPRLFHTHIPRVSLPASVEESGCRVVYVWRDPKDVIVSWWHYINNSRRQAGKYEVTIDAVVEDFVDGLLTCGNYWDHVLEYWNYNSENQGRVLFLKYEEMMDDPIGNLKNLSEFVGKPFSAEEEQQNVIQEIVKLCSIDSLKNMPINKKGNYIRPLDSLFFENASFFRKGKVGDWALHLSREMSERIDEITQSKFGASGLLSL